MRNMVCKTCGFDADGSGWRLHKHYQNSSCRKSGCRTGSFKPVVTTEFIDARVVDGKIRITEQRTETVVRDLTPEEVNTLCLGRIGSELVRLPVPTPTNGPSLARQIGNIKQRLAWAIKKTDDPHKIRGLRSGATRRINALIAP